MFRLSTSEMPETAASPTLATIMVSAMPMVTASSCSITSGTISLRRPSFENSMDCFNLRQNLFVLFYCASICVKMQVQSR